MTKISLFFISLLTILITGCNNDDYYERGSSDTKQSKTAHWYGVKQLSDSVSLRSAADRMKLWAQDPVITVKFLNSPDDPAVIDQIKAYAKEWEQYAGVAFSFVETSENALVRIGFDWDGNSWLTWSYTGNDAKMVRNQNEPTACFGGFSDGVMSDEEIKGDVLRVFGQILGLEFEQRHQGWDPSWWKKDKNGVYYAEKYWEGMFDGYYENLDWETIRQFVFDPLAGATIVQTADVDFESIMMWPYYTKKETVKLYANYELSDGDKEFIATLYPKKEGNTIQTAWVDAGYFVWVNAEKTQLRITEKGAQMEELPDVIDGEQLTSVKGLFGGYPYNMNPARIRKAPKFNTSNVSDFSGMFSGSPYLREIPLYDTSNGVDFKRMFYCSSIQKVAFTDLSKGENFEWMFLGCGELTDVYIPELSNALNLNNMFASCKSLINISTIKAPKAEAASAMFMGCSSLVSFDGLYMPNIPSLMHLFRGCESLKYVSNIDVSSAENLVEMFKECTSLIEVSNLNTSKCESFGAMFYKCTSLKQAPILDTSNGLEFGAMFYDCEQLMEVPCYDTSNAYFLGSMFAGCQSLKQVPPFNTSKCKYFLWMFDDCKSLQTIPDLDTSSGVRFNQMFYKCESLTDVPILNVSKGTVFEEMFYGANNLSGVKMSGFGQGGDKQEDNIRDDNANPLVLDFTSSGLHVSGLQYIIDNTVGSTPARRIRLHKSLQPKVSADLIAQAAAKNIKFEFIY